MNIGIVTVIGANGTLGIGVSAIFASFGNAKVYMISRTLEKSNKAIEMAANSVKAETVSDNMIAKTYEDISECIKDSDLIIETIVEDYDEKVKIHSLINKYARNDAICSTVTSGISINKLSQCYDKEKRKRFMGIHFFNPPYSLQLCELIPSQETDQYIINEVEEYLSNTLHRKVIITKDKPAFLANRIGFQFINKCMQYAEKYKDEGGIDYIDTIIGRFTGRSMPPIYTADFVRIRCSQSYC